VATASSLLASEVRASTPEQDGIISQVIVTAERRPLDMQTVPLSVSALTADDIRSFNLTGTMDLPSAVPGLNFTQQGIGATPFIRGIGTMSGAIGNESPVSVYLDGVYITAPTAAVFSLVDVRQVEVLRGPQGTLFGRNATGGVIEVFRREPAYEPAAEVRVQIASYSTTEASLYTTAGLGEHIAASLTLHHKDQQSGWGTNLATGESTFRHEELGAATKFVWAPAPETRLSIGASYVDRDGEDGIGYHIVPGSVAADGHTRYSGFYNSWADPQDRGGYRHAIISARLEQQFSAFQLVNTASWQQLHAFFRLDQDETPTRIVDAPITQYGRTITEELQALSNDNAVWPWIVGLYYLHDVSAYDPLTLQGLAALPLESLSIYSEQRTRSYALYAQSTIPLAAHTRLTLGGRYTSDHRSIDGHTVGQAGGDRTTLADVQQSAVWKKPTWRVALSHDLTDTVMTFVSWDRGFKSGVFNLLSYASEPVFPEVLDAYQAGIKSEWLERRLRLNATGFVYRYENIQVESVVAGATVSVNAAASKMHGAEVELEFVPTARLSLRAGIALLDGEYTDFHNAPINVPNRDSRGNLIGGNTVISGDATGNRTIRSPRTSATLQSSYGIPTAIGQFEMSVAYAYTSRFAWDPDNRLQQSPFDMLNAALSWTAPNEAFSVRASGSNLTQSQSSIYTVASALGDFRSPRAPRVLALELLARF